MRCSAKRGTHEPILSFFNREFKKKKTKVGSDRNHAKRVSVLKGGHLIVSKRRLLQDWVFFCCSFEPCEARMFMFDCYRGFNQSLQCNISCRSSLHAAAALAGLNTNHSKLSFILNAFEAEALLMSQQLPCFKNKKQDKKCSLTYTDENRQEVVGEEVFQTHLLTARS